MSMADFFIERRRQMQEHEARVRRMNDEHARRMHEVTEEAAERMRLFSEQQDHVLTRMVEIGLEPEEREAIRAAAAQREEAMAQALAQVEQIGKHHQRLNRWSSWFCWGMFWLSGFLFRGAIHGW